MSLILLIYLADIVGAFIGVTVVFSIILLLIAGAMAGYHIDRNENPLQKPLFTKAVIFFIISVSLFIFTPSKNAIYTMAAIKYGEEISKNKKIEELGSKVYTILNSKLDQMIEEIPKKEKK